MQTSAPASRATSSFSGAARRGEHARAERLADLHGGEADAAGGGVHEQRLARLEARAQHERGVRRRIDDRERGAFLERHARRACARRARAGTTACSAKAPSRDRGEDAIADAEAVDLGADRAHDARDLGARHERQRRLHLVASLHHQDVEEVAAGRLDVDREPAREELGLRRVGDTKLPRLDEPIDDDRAHALRTR